MTTDMWISAITLVMAYVLIFSEVIHRTNAAIIGAVVMIAVGSYQGFYSQAEAIMAVDANTMFLLAGMMMVVVLLRPTGGFEYVAIRIAKFAGHDQKVLLVALSAAVSIISMFLDNVTTVLIFAPLTVVIAKILVVNPLPFLMAEAMLSNIGGAATLVGDPPNIMIGSSANLDFVSFLIHMGPLVASVWFTTVFMVLLTFKSMLASKPSGSVDLDESKAIVDPRGLKQALFALTVVIILFFVHHHLHLYPSYVAFIGVAIAVALMRPDPEPLFGKVEWSVLAFFCGLFMIVGGVEHSGLLDLIGMKLSVMASDPQRLMMTCLLMMWVAAIVSAIVDNIPFTVTMIPIVQGLESQGINVFPLWWALAIGVGLGGNGSHIGATANVICVAESEKSGIPEARITPLLWIKKGFPIMIFSLSVASIVYALAFEYFVEP